MTIKFRYDRQFLPAALEVLETPSSPTRRALLLTMCAFAGLAAAWGFLGRVDIEAVAKGKVQPAGRVKVIEPLEPGRVSTILVEDGAEIKSGEQLLTLDPVEVKADESAAVHSLAVDVADAARYKAAVELAATRDDLERDDARIEWNEVVPEDLRLREQQALAADLLQLAETLRNFDLQKSERQATLSRLEGSLEADNRLAATLRQRVEMRQVLASHGNGTKADYLDSLQELQRAEASVMADRGQRGETLAAIATLVSDRSKILKQFFADNTNKFEDASNKAVLDTQSLAKARVHVARATLVSPIDGVVQKLAVTSIGQVVTTGQDLMIIVPNAGTLNVEAFIENIDIGFVKVGQDVVIKLDAFPFTRYGTIQGKVVKIATDAIDEEEARSLQANATSLINSASRAASSNNPNQKFVFPIVISLNQKQFFIGSKTVSDHPGYECDGRN